MTNSINQQTMQYSMPPQGQMMQPSPSVGAVNIQIYNPTAGMGGYSNVAPMYPSTSFYNQPMAYPYPCPYPVMTPPQAPMAPQANASAQATVAQAPQPTAQAPQPAAAAPAQEAPKEEEKTEKKVQLTDDYIKSLENYLNNENPKIRMMGAKELLERFKEDKSRTTDVALTALLNKALQDPTASVRFMALTVLDVGYAAGNDETVNILKQIQTMTQEQYGEDALLASQILLKMSGETVDVPSGTGFKTEQPKSKEK